MVIPIVVVSSNSNRVCEQEVLMGAAQLVIVSVNRNGSSSIILILIVGMSRRCE